MARTKDRQRALARAKLERQIARRAATARRKRQVQAGTAAGIALVLTVLGGLWLGGVFEADKKTTAGTDCAWTAEDGNGAKDVGRPPTRNVPRGGIQTMTIATSQGQLDVLIDVAKVPCTAASFSFLAGKKFFDNTKCHRLTNSGIFVLQCGDPSGTGTGGPGYRFGDENLPTTPPPPSGQPTPDPSTEPQTVYPQGTVAMANSGIDTNGSQFFIIYKDSPLGPKYTRLGTVTRGLDVVEKVAAAGVAEGGKSPNDGPPKTEVVIQSLTMGPPSTAGDPSAGPSGAASSSAGT